MPTYRYIGRDSAGEKTSGSLEALTSIDAFNQLRRRGMAVDRLDIEDGQSSSSQRGPGGLAQEPAGVMAAVGESAPATLVDAGEPASAEARLGVEDLAEIAGRIAEITRSRLPLAPGLRALGEELPSRSLRRGLVRLSERLERGEPLEDALQAGGTAIPSHIAGLIIVGVRSGRLGEIMEWFLKHVRRQLDLRRRCRASLLYPALLLTAGIVACAFAVAWLVPDMKRLYQDFEIELPTLTAWMFVVSDFLRSFGLLILGAILAVIAAVPLLLGLVGGKPLRHRFLAGCPFIGTMFRCSALAGFCELVAMFVTGRLPLPEAVRLAGAGSGDADLEMQFQRIADCLQQGQDDTELFRRLSGISPQLIHVFHWKSRESTFLESLAATARIYENQAQTQIALGGMFVEPIVIIGVLSGVALFVVSMFLPLIKILYSLQ